jgi:phosphoglycolate phosphatase
MAGFGAPLVAGTDRAAAFSGGRAMLRAGFARLGHATAEVEVERLYPRLLDFYRDGICVHTELYEGVRPALDRLAAADWRLAVCTNKPEALAVRLVDLLGLGGHFVALTGADTLAFRKPDPRHLTETVARAGGIPARAVLVGDTATDRAAALGAGVPCVLVGFGPDAEAVTRLTPEAVLGHYDDLPDLLERLVPRGHALSTQCVDS